MYEVYIGTNPHRVQAEIKGKIDISFWFYKPLRKWLKQLLDKRKTLINYKSKYSNKMTCKEKLLSYSMKQSSEYLKFGSGIHKIKYGQKQK